MRRILLPSILIVQIGLTGVSGAAETVAASKGSLYSFSTDEESTSEALDRVSGDIDRGYSSDEFSYKSANHYTPSPFGREEAARNASEQ